MQALTFHGPGRVACERVPDPELLQPGDVILRVTATAICGSDLHVWRGSETGLDEGTVLGHEFVGEVVAAGAGASAFPIGTHVVSPFTTSCGECAPCREGLTSRCLRGELFGWVEEGRGLHGGQAELVRVPLAASSLVALPEGADPEVCLFAGDVFSTGTYCAELGGAGPGRTVAVLGCGPVGLMAVIAARELRSERVFALDPVEERRALARDFGAEPLDPGEGVVERLRELTDGRGVDAVLEAVGSPSATRLALDLVRAGGTIAAAGVHTEKSFAFGPGEAYDKNLTYRAGRCPARHYMERLVALAASGKYDLARIVSHRLPLSEGPRAYDLFDRKLDGCTKVVLRP